MSILEEIFREKRKEVKRMRAAVPLEVVAAAAEAYPHPVLDFDAHVRGYKAKTGSPGLIAEIKRASPSKGTFAANLEIASQVELYRANGAAAISILTDRRYFRGSIEDLRVAALFLASSGPRLPLLRKDFICDPYQVYEARASGADAILLILARLDDDSANELFATARELGMAALFETHNHAEIERALRIGARIIGINNRNLHDFSVSLETTRVLSEFIPAGVCLISESGIHSYEDVSELAACGVDGVLVGESIVTAPDPGQQVRMLSGLERNLNQVNTEYDGR